MINEILFFCHSITLLGIIAYATQQSLPMLTTCLAFNMVFANFFVLKQIILFGFTVTATDVFIVSITLGLGVMQKFYGEKAVRNAITINIFASFVYLVCTTFHLAYQAAPIDYAHQHYQTLLEFMPRIMIASLFVSWCTEQFNRVLIRNFLKLFNPTAATIWASCIAQTVDTIAFSILGLYGIAHSIVDIIQVSLIIKYTLLIISTPIIHCIYRFIKVHHAQV